MGAPRAGRVLSCEARWYDSDGEMICFFYQGEETEGCDGDESYDLGACTPR